MRVVRRPKRMNSPLISVVVCTYDRASLLARMLRTLCDQDLEKSYYEVVIVDNNSRDHTRQVVEQFTREFANVRYCFEPVQGLSHARNRGWQVARGEYVAFIDDDCKASRDWLAVAKDVIERLSPGAFGGPSYALYDSPKPRWYRDCYISHEPYKEARILNRHECVNIYGHNMFFRRAALEHLGGFDPKLGMSGGKVAYGEETALLKLMASTMPDELVYYEPRLYVYNLVRKDKMTMRWIARSWFASGRMCYQVFGTTGEVPNGKRQLAVRAVKIVLALVRSVVQSVVNRDRARYPYVQNYLYDRASAHLQKLGMLYEGYMQVADGSPVKKEHEAAT